MILFNMHKLAAIMIILSVSYTSQAVLKASCKLNEDKSTNEIGTISFSQDGDIVTITGNIKNLVPQGNHGFHIHEKPVTGGDCLSTGGHFNPDNKDHGAPTDAIRHVGDLGNIVAAADGTVNLNFSDKVISLDSTSTHNIVGKACVVHQTFDDLGKGAGDSKINGNAGKRLACGDVILIQNAFRFAISAILTIFIVMLLFV
jgi:superoxide dismutase, Cu-Zn family